LGNQKNVSDILSIDDLKLLMSEQERFSLVLLEAMACEVPSVGTNVGGFPEVIEDGKKDDIVEVGDPVTAANLAVVLLSDEEKLIAFSKAAKDHVNDTFSSAKIVDEYIDLYRNLLYE